MSEISFEASGKARHYGAFAIIIGAGAWGLFWIPLRYLNSIGITGMWAVALVLGLPWILAIPMVIRRSHLLDSHYVKFGFVFGLSTVLYFGAVIYSDVVRVILLFYLLPIWATLLGRVMHGEAIPPIKIFAILLALAGLYLLLGSDDSLPIPQNLGDWFGMAAGFLWALSLVLIRGKPDLNPSLHTTALFIFGAPLACIVALIMPDTIHSIAETAPHTDGGVASGLTSARLAWALAVALGFGLLVLAPSVFAQVWGARLLPSGTAALLTMSEILTATLSAILLAGSELTPAAFLGGAMIILAALLDLTGKPRGV
jgi:drug/metabolite transporter (DMT)-like permease